MADRVEVPFVTDEVTFGGRSSGKTASVMDVLSHVATPPAEEPWMRELFTYHAQSRLQRPALPPIKVHHINPAAIDQHMIDAMMYGQGAQTLRAPPPPVVPTIESFRDAELIMEMLKRGYACMKLPADGGPPEVLRNG